MTYELKKFLQSEVDELKQNKIRAIALGVCFFVVVVIWAGENFSRGDEIALNDPPPVATVNTPPTTATKDLPLTSLPAGNNLDGVTELIGANTEPLNVTDPFAAEEKSEPKPTAPPATVEPIPPAQIQPLPAAPPAPTPPKPREQIILIGTAISGTDKTAMLQLGKQTMFFSVGDVIDGRRIIDIGTDFVTLDDGETLRLQKELK